MLVQTKMGDRTKPSLSNRIVALMLAAVWLTLGAIGFLVGLAQARWLLLGIGTLAVAYGLLWVRVVKLGKQLQWPDDLKLRTMPKPLKVALLLLMVAALGAICWRLLTDSEPSYQGRLLHVWLANFDLYGRKQPEKAEEALRALGTNALPLLTRMIHAKDPHWKSVFMVLNERQSVIHLDLTEARVIRYRAVEGYRVLGAEAKPSVPFLILLMTSEPSADVRIDVATALGWIGPEAKEAIPILIQVANDPNPLLRRSALFALANIQRWSPDRSETFERR
jgi:hypothetical protein